jgi:hypothetical protein
MRSSRSVKIRQDPDWGAEVQGGLSWLFAEQCATLVDSTCQAGSFGLKTATIKVSNIILKVFRDATLPPDYIEARIAPVHAPTDFKPPVSAWMALELMAHGTIPSKPPYKEFTLQGLSKLLQQNFVQLNEAFSMANYPTIRQRIDEIEQEHWRQLEQKHSQK